MKFCVYEYSTEEMHIVKSLTNLFINLLLFLSLYINFVIAKLFTDFILTNRINNTVCIEQMLQYNIKITQISINHRLYQKSIIS